MTKGFMGDREKALEESYFRQQDAKLLDKLRHGASLDEIAIALRDKLQVDNPELLASARESGVTAETAPAFLLAPLVQVAWAEGKVGKHEREAVLRLAHDRGVASGTPAHDQLLSWLEQRPSDTLFDTALDVIKAGFDVLPHVEREERIERIVHACHEVAAGSGSEIARLLGLGDGVSGSEETVMGTIEARLRGRAG
ncbi:hypothetical protein G7076_10210 [Sphingomonas sp. HDW15A]|uniref:hypothetical protein n=1 Tax=Sphingomonas sp. HDW15A TaxID=2714942 RepID=UPI00140D9ED1|nr:hypothetical protein [Sphingomonas sp. HDW15A]QIK96759.1 hypothetical protein G7076_10210 [Sphingomonas sp. HDW15A]